MVHQERIAIGAGVAGFLVLGAMALLAVFPDQPVPAGLDPVRSLGNEMLGDSMLIFESAGLVLLTTMIGVVVLSSHRGRMAQRRRARCRRGWEPGGDPAGKPEEDEEGEGGHHPSSPSPLSGTDQAGRLA